MKLKLQIAALFIVMTAACFGQQGTTWDKWTWLMGEWKGEGSGQPGQGSGTFSFVFDLDKKIIVRTSHSEYPATPDNPEVIHKDLMIIYLDSNVEPRAIFFDNEGHVINYSIVTSDNSIRLTSEIIANIPVFRLIYTLLDNNLINTKFEMSQDGKNFITYIEGKSKKIK